MQLTEDTTTREPIVVADRERSSLPLHSPEAFQLLSREWASVSRGLRSSYTLTWLGRRGVMLL